MEDESRLVEGLKRGDEGAFEQAFKQLKPRLYATAVHFLGYNDPEAEDAVQDAFLRGLKALPGFEGRSSLYTWFNAICVRVCFDRLRTRGRTLATQSEDLDLLQTGAAKRQHQQDQERAEDQEKGRALDGLLQRMDGPCQEVLALRFKEGLAMHDVAQKLRWPLGTVSSRLSRCQEALRKLARRAGLLR